jgi:hypothetical protein
MINEHGKQLAEQVEERPLAKQEKKLSIASGSASGSLIRLCRIPALGTRVGFHSIFHASIHFPSCLSAIPSQTFTAAPMLSDDPLKKKKENEKPEKNGAGEARDKSKSTDKDEKDKDKDDKGEEEMVRQFVGDLGYSWLLTGSGQLEEDIQLRN